MKELTVEDLYIACKKQIEKGNGNKIVLVTDDDEANGYHALWYSIDDNIRNIGMCRESFHDNNNPKDVVLLG